ncbi:hypothetical protein ACJIZ3_012212 [Penstemon smallii]|uniref:Elongation factor EFG domain-containing protein n=1 Tax=Penstemon smallii TaxID=265156 RepID=A0ABD3UPY3_9LAMI
MDEEVEQISELTTIKPVKRREHEAGEVSLTPQLEKLILKIMSDATRVRNVALVGPLQHGKTSFTDMLVKRQHADFIDIASPVHNIDKYTQFTTKLDELERTISIKAVPISLVLQNSNSVPHLCNIMETPGHPDFSDELIAALRLADGEVLIVDAVEGVTVRCFVVLLIGELKLSPEVAYYKLQDTIKVINEHIKYVTPPAEHIQAIDPSYGNVCYASAKEGWLFTLQSFAKQCAKLHPNPFDANNFASYLWGDWYFDPVDKCFKEKQADSGAKLSFVQFVLEPLHKLHSQGIEVDNKNVEATFREVCLISSCSNYQLNDRSAFGSSSATGFTDMLVEHIPSAGKAARHKLKHIYPGSKTSGIYLAMESCYKSGSLMADIPKLYPRYDWRYFDSFGRVYSGEIEVGDTIGILSSDNDADDDEDPLRILDEKVTMLWVYLGRQKVCVNKVPAGAWVLIEVDNGDKKATTFCRSDIKDFHPDVRKFKPLQLNPFHVVKRKVEATIEATNRETQQESYRDLCTLAKSYAPMITEGYGDYTILGTGELYLDSAWKDLTELYSALEWKSAGPFVSFSETISKSSAKCSAVTCDEKNKITVALFKYRFPSVLLDVKLLSEIDDSLLKKVAEFIHYGFRHHVREGPLCGEPMRDVTFRILDLEIEPYESDGYRHDIVAMVYRAAYLALLKATPVLMEPLYRVQIYALEECRGVILELLNGRRGDIISEVTQSTCTYEAKLPVTESFGFAKELHHLMRGQAHCSLTFDGWAIAPFLPSCIDQTFSSPVKYFGHKYVLETRRLKKMYKLTSDAKFDEMTISLLAGEDSELHDQLVGLQHQFKKMIC